MDSSKDSIKLGGKKPNNQDNTIADILKKFAENPKVINEKNLRCKFFATLDPKDIPTCYQQNSPKEELVLEHVKEFEKHFPLVFRNYADRELYLFPPNECGLQKFICTTVRPTKLGYLELYNYDECATTIARYLQYEELDPADEYPETLPSPSNVLNWQKGDCFDFSIVLCSLLIGVGYDAYVCFGKAPRAITSCNEALLENPESTEIKERQDDEVELDEVQKVNDYTINEKSVKNSNFDKDVKVEKEQKKLRKYRMETVIDDYEPNKMGLDLYRNKRKHAWVFVKKGKRDIKEDFFLEPSTGRKYTVDNCEYVSIDSVFNNQNFWINIDEKTPISDINFDNMNVKCKEWEYIMLDTLDIPYNMEDEFDNPDDMDEAAMHQKALRTMKQILDMPPPWPPKLIIPYEKYRLGSPLGEETKFYVKSKVDIYGESYNANQFQIDGLVKCITTYEDFLRNIVEEVQYYYKNRQDKLYLRVRRPFQFTTIDYYNPGKQNCWKKVTYIDRRKRVVDFYPNRNEDGLIQRIENINEGRTTEHYINRDDKVTYRMIEFKPVLPDEPKAGFTHIYPDHNLDCDCYITRMEQQMTKSPNKPPGQQIYRMIVDSGKNKVSIHYHLNPGDFAPKTEILDKNQLNTRITENNQNVENPEQEAKNRYIQNLEKECFQSMRTRDEDTRSQLKDKHDMDQSISTCMSTNDHILAKQKILEKSLADKARDNLKKKQQQLDLQQSDELKKESILLPYLHGKTVDDLSTQEKTYIKSQIMDKLKQRILNRGDIIHKRLEQERQDFQKLQQDLNRKTEGISQEDQKKQEEKIKLTEFRVKILDSRAYKFQMNALEKYTKMDQELTNDLKMNNQGGDVN